MSPPRSRSAPPSSSSSPSSPTSSCSGPGCPGELPALRARRLDLSRRPLRRGEEPEPDPPRRLPRHRPVVHLRPAPLDRLRQPRHGPDLRGRAEGNPRRRPRRAGADADRRRGQRHRRLAAPRARHPDAAARRHDRSGRARRDARLMDVLVPLPVAIPLVAAAGLTATGHFLGRRADDLVGIATAASATVISTLLILRSLDHDLVYWFGGWTPLHGPPDGLLAVAFALLLAGFLVKAGAVPFHFWLSDAYAVAPIPVCVVLSGVMSDLGLHAIARIYWPAFSGVFAAHTDDLRAILVGAGVLTALVGGTMAFFQRNLKRLLAFVTIGHVGIFLAGIGLLTARALAGTTLYVIADGFVKGGLFLGVGILLRRARHGDELRLRGKGGAAPMAGVIFLAGGLGLAGLPPFGTFPGSALIIRSAGDVGYGWLPAVLAFASILAAGTVLRAGARIFLGLGDEDDPSLSREPSAVGEEPEHMPGRVSPALLFGPALALLAGGVGLPFPPRPAGRATQWAQRLEDRPAHSAEVLGGVVPAPVSPPGFHPGAAPYVYGAVSTVGAFAFALFGLYRRRLPALLRRAGGRRTARPPAPL